MLLAVKKIARNILDHRPWFDGAYFFVWYFAILRIARSYPREMRGELYQFYMMLCVVSLLVIVAILKKIAAPKLDTVKPGINILPYIILVLVGIVIGYCTYQGW